MLTREQKKELVKNLAQKIKDAKSVVFVDYKGLKVKNITDLKKELKNNKSDFKVVKKTLISRALKNAGLKLDVTDMEGQVALVVSGDETSGARVIYNFGKGNKNLKILKGMLDAKEMNMEEMETLAKIPSKEELLGKLVGTINAPVSGFVNVLAGNIRGLVQAIKGIADSRKV